VIRCIVGLGNPGPQYACTRHNIGFMVADSMALQAGAAWHKRLWSPYWLTELAEPAAVMLCKPATFMNHSGKAVAALIRKKGLSPDQILVMYDDVHLPLGRARYRPRGSAGGHNGVQSVIDWLGDESFPRLRLGIGHGTTNRIAHVLGSFSANERPIAEQLVAFAAGILPLLVCDDAQLIMQQVNSWHAADQ